MGNALLPEIRTVAMAPMPCGVAMAQMVSLFKMLDGILLMKTGHPCHSEAFGRENLWVAVFNIILEGQVVHTVFRGREEIRRRSGCGRRLVH